MDRFLHTLLDNLVFLVVLMPIAGVVLVGLSSRLGADAVRRTAVVNAVVTSLLALAMAGRFVAVQANDDAPREQMTTSLRWLAAVEVEVQPSENGGSVRRTLAGPNVRLSFGADGFNVGFLALVAALAVPVVAFGPQSDSERPGTFYALLLAYEACLLGAFGALDVLVFCLFSEGALLPAFLLVGGWGGYDRRVVARKFLVFNLAGSVLIVLGLSTVVVAHRWTGASLGLARPATFDFARLFVELRGWTAPGGEAAAVWSRLGPWAFATLLLGFLIRSAIPPFHTWFVPVTLESPTSPLLLLGAAGTKLGLYGVLRFVLPLFPEAAARASGFVVGLCVLGVVYAGLLVLGQGDLRKLLACAVVAHGAVAWAGAFSLTSAGFVGAALHAVHQGLVFAALAALVHVLERRYGTRDIEAFGGLSGRLPRLSLLFTLAALAMIGVPGGLGFVSQLLIVGGVFSNSGTRAAWLLAGLLICAWAFVWLLQRVFQGRFRQPIEDETGYGTSGGTRWSTRSMVYDLRRDLTWRELAVISLPLTLVFALGLVPGPFVAALAPTAEVVLRTQPRATAGTDDGDPPANRRGSTASLPRERKSEEE